MGIKLHDESGDFGEFVEVRGEQPCDATYDGVPVAVDCRSRQIVVRRNDIVVIIPVSGIRNFSTPQFNDLRVQRGESAKTTNQCYESDETTGDHVFLGGYPFEVRTGASAALVNSYYYSRNRSYQID